MGFEPKMIPKSMENYVSVQVDCLGFLNSYLSFLSSGLDKLVKSLDNLPKMKSAFGMDDKLFKKKLAYPYHYLSHNNFQDPPNLTKEDFWSTLKQPTPPDEENNRTQEIIKKFNTKNGQE